MEQLSPRVCCPPWTVLEMFAQRNCQKANHVVKGVAIYLCSNSIAEERRQPSERSTGIPISGLKTTGPNFNGPSKVPLQMHNK